MFGHKVNITSQNDSPLKILYKMQNGYIKELEDKVGTEKVRQFEAIGYIENAPSEKGYTFKITPRANHIGNELYGAYSLSDFFSDIYYRYIKRVHFSLR